MHNPHTRELRETLLRLSNYAFVIEGYLEREAEALGTRLEEDAKSYPESERADFVEANISEVVEISNEMPTLLRHSVLTAADSAIERHLVDTCRTHSDLKKLPWPPTPPWRSGLHGAKEFLKSIAGIEFPDQHPSWSRVLRLRELRNALVHADADLSSSPKVLCRWILKQEHLSISSGTVSLRSQFLYDALSWYENFAEVFDQACEPLSLWYSVFPPIENDESAV